MRFLVAVLFVWVLGVFSTLALAQAKPAIPVHRTDRDEPEAAWLERWNTFRDSVTRATKDPTERAFLVVTAREESGLARFVWYDWPKCRTKGSKWCDGGRAFGIYQLQGTRRDLTLDEQTARALDRYRKGLGSCKTLEGAIAQYATGRSCEWPKAAARAASVRAIRGLL